MNDFLAWCQTSPISLFIKGSKWPYPAVEILHITGLVLVFGSILVLNLRIFGRILREQPVSVVAAGLAPITLFGVIAQFLTGPVLFMATAARFWGNGPFRLKLVLLAVALTYHFGVHRSLALRAEKSYPALKASAAVSMLLWIAVVLSGMSIELLS